jgi:hypothetical protein
MTATITPFHQKPYKPLTDEEFNILEDWHSLVDDAADKIDEEIKRRGVKDCDYDEWHTLADELCAARAPDLFAQRPVHIADREGYDDAGLSHLTQQL